MRHPAEVIVPISLMLFLAWGFLRLAMDVDRNKRPRRRNKSQGPI